MDSPVTKLIFIAAAVAASALVAGIMWTTLGNNAPSTSTDIQGDRIQTQELCEAVGWTWTDSPATSTPNCTTT